MCEDGNMSLLIDNIKCKSVPSLHQNIQIILVQLHPSGVVAWIRSIHGMNQGQMTLAIFLVSPDFVSSKICGVEIGFCVVKYHAVDPSLGHVLIILDAFLKASFVVD